MKTNRVFLLLVVAASLLAISATALERIPLSQLSLETLFRVKPFAGNPPRIMAFSASGRYLAFLWNPFAENGTDLYLYHTASGRMVRLTSLEKMKAYDTPEDHEKFKKKAKQKREEEETLQRIYDAQKDFLEGKNVDLGSFEREQIERLKEEEAAKKAEEAKKKEEQKTEKDEKGQEKKKGEREEWEWRDELKKKMEKEKIKPEDLYPGVNRLAWATKADELIFEYRGDLFRYLPRKDELQRLTLTDRREILIGYTPTDDGFYFRDDKVVYLARFNSGVLRQLNHELNPEEKFKIDSTSVSPNGKWLAIMAAKPEATSSEREVQYMSYKTRFAEPKKTKREVADDKRTQPTYRLYLRRVPDGDHFDRESEPVFSIAGGDVWYEYTPLSWSKDGSAYAFATWEQEKTLLRVWIGKAADDAKPEVIYENKGPIGPDVFSLVNPFFTPDGSRLVIIADEGGFRRPLIIDIKTKAYRPLLTGDFESHPLIGFSRDSRFLFTVSDREDPAMTSIYKVDLASGQSWRVSMEGGVHRASVISKDCRWLGTVFGNWEKRPELFLIDLANGSRKVLTSSHDPEWERFQLLKPSLFKFKNRHGDTISGLVFKPPDWKMNELRPGIVYIYGGPLGTGHTVEADTFNTATYLFNMYMTVKHGYVAVAVDPRGQSGYGRRFSDANFENPGRPQVEDLEDLVKYMGGALGVDARRLGLHGWSFGGFQTQMTMYSSPDLFACGIAGAGPTEWENYNSWYAGRTIGPSVRGTPSLRKYSLLPLAKNLKKPLLLVHGMEDDNVLYQDTVNVYRALLESGKETLVELFVDPEGKHGLGGVVSNKARFKKYEDWFLKHLGSGQKLSAPGS